MEFKNNKVYLIYNVTCIILKISSFFISPLSASDAYTQQNILR